MSNESSENFPKFSRVFPVVPNEVPESVGRILSNEGVPASLIGFEYEALDTVVIISGDGQEDLVAFGSCGIQGRVCLEGSTGRVVHVAHVSSSEVNPVNSTFDLFVSCVRAVIERFPFYGEEEAEEKAEQVAEEVSDVLLGIDSEVFSMNGFWQTFIDDVAIGDYSTEIIRELRIADRQM